jgi:hypothetical protein
LRKKPSQKSDRQRDQDDPGLIEYGGSGDQVLELTGLKNFSRSLGPRLVAACD